MDFTPLAVTTIVSLASAAPASLEARFPTGRYNNVLPPSATSIYYGQNGAIDYGVNRGEVSRNNWNGLDNSTLVTFDLNGRNLPDKCSLRFWLEPNSQYNDPTRGSFVSGTGSVDVFSSLQPAPCPNKFRCLASSLATCFG